MAALMNLSGPSYGPAAGGTPRQLVFLLHGYGDDGHGLLGLAPHWAPLLPHAEFLSPNAPFPCEIAPYGRQWFGFEGRDASMILGEVQTASTILNAFVDEQLAKRKLDDSSAAFVGFSQGTMMSLHVGPRRAKPLAGIVGYSGHLAAGPPLAEEARAKPEILLVHGDMDELIPVDAMFMAREQLAQAGLAVEWHVAQGIGHGIDPEGLRLGGAFLRQAFAAAQVIP